MQRPDGERLAEPVVCHHDAATIEMAIDPMATADPDKGEIVANERSYELPRGDSATQHRFTA